MWVSYVVELLDCQHFGKNVLRVSRGQIRCISQVLGAAFPAISRHLVTELYSLFALKREVIMRCIEKISLSVYICCVSTMQYFSGLKEVIYMKSSDSKKTAMPFKHCK